MPVVALQLTAEQIVARNAQINAKRRENAAQLRSGFSPDDEAEWQHLATLAGVRLPNYGVPITTAAVERWLRTLEISHQEYFEWFGAARRPKLADFAEMNPTCPLKKWVGMMLEYLDRRGRIQMTGGQAV